MKKDILKYNLPLLFLLLFGLIFITSCEKKVRPLKPRTIKLIDTLFTQQWKVLEPQQDSLCQVEKSQIFKAAYDSILQIRTKEKSELIQYEIQ